MTFSAWAEIQGYLILGIIILISKFKKLRKELRYSRFANKLFFYA